MEVYHVYERYKDVKYNIGEQKQWFDELPDFIV